MKVAFTLLIASLFLLNAPLWSQTNPVNAYARVSSISGTTLTLVNVNETFDTYENGERVLIIQIQDDVIGANTSNNASFGDLSSIQSTGLYEFATIVSHTEVAGLPATVTVSAPLLNSYNTGANSRVQIVSFPRLGSPNYTTSSNIGGLSWNGNIGGVIAFEVTGVLTLNHNINADGIGFRGGNSSVNHSGPTNCSATNIFISNSNQLGFKGEGIYTNTNANFNTSRAKMLNGGGGGSHHNGGGAGGGNLNAGGNGGPGYNGTAAGCAASPVGGIGGLGLSPYISSQRLFFGGGGGGGQANNSVGTNGGNGGGFVYIAAGELRSAASCTNVRISANGLLGANAGNDGAGGGGAAGSILLNIPSFNIQSTCPLQVQANGGNGGNVNSSTHAGGGGGSQGVIIYTSALPTANVSNNSTNGTGGCNNTGCTSRAENGTGLNNSGVFDILAVSLQSFEAKLLNNNEVLLEWISALEEGNESFTLERSSDALNFEPIYNTRGAGYSTEEQYYSYTDFTPLSGTNYYRLKQTDFDGRSSYSDIVAVTIIDSAPSISVYPNPARDFIKVRCDISIENFDYTIFNSNGQIMKTGFGNPQHTVIETAELPRGIYILQLKTEDAVKTLKVVLN